MPSISIVAGRDGTVWIGTEGGGSEPAVWRPHIHATRRESGLPSNYMGALFEASDGAVWITGDGVVTRLQGGKPHVYTTADGVPGGLRLGNCRRSTRPTRHLRRRVRCAS